MDCNKKNSIGSSNFLKIKHRFLRGSIQKQSLILIWYSMIVTAIAVILLSIGNNTSLFNYQFLIDSNKMLFYVGAFDGVDAGTLSTKSDYNRVTHILHTFTLILIVAIWQAVLIFKMMQVDKGIQLSNYITYTEWLGEKSLEFRFLNDGFNTLYNVKITALLRIKPSNGPYRSYRLNIRNSEIPILEVGMPYGIDIETGVIKNVNTEMLFIDSGRSQNDKSSYLPVVEYKETKDNSCEDGAVELLPHPLNKEYLNNINRKEMPHEAQILVMVEAFDDFLEQTIIVNKRYNYHKLQEGRCANIESRLEQAEKTKNKEKIEEAKDYISNPENYDKGWIMFNRDEVWSKFNQPFEQKEKNL